MSTIDNILEIIFLDIMRDPEYYGLHKKPQFLDDDVMEYEEDLWLQIADLDIIGRMSIIELYLERIKK